MKIVEKIINIIDMQPDLVLKVIGNLIQTGPKEDKHFKLLQKEFILKLIQNIKVNFVHLKYWVYFNNKIKNFNLFYKPIINKF